MVFLPPCPKVGAAWANRYLKQNASEAGNHRVGSCCPFGSRHSHRAGFADLLNVEFYVDGRTGCIRDLSAAGAYYVACGNVCLPAHSASTKVAGGIDDDHFVSDIDRAIFHRHTIVRAAEGYATATTRTPQ